MISRDDNLDDPERCVYLYDHDLERRVYLYDLDR